MFKNKADEFIRQFPIDWWVGSSFCYQTLFLTILDHVVVNSGHVVDHRKIFHLMSLIRISGKNNPYTTIWWRNFSFLLKIKFSSDFKDNLPRLEYFYHQMFCFYWIQNNTFSQIRWSKCIFTVYLVLYRSII